MLKNLIKQIVYSIPIFKRYYVKKLVDQGAVVSLKNLNSILDEADKVLLQKPLKTKFFVGLVKDGDRSEGFVNKRAYYPKYERFLKNNDIEFAYYDIFNMDWQEKAKNYDVVIWHTDSDPATQETAINKIYVLEKLMGIKCLPSFDEIWTYENKVNAHYLYKHFNLPEIPTVVSHSKADALEYAEKANYPIISKLSTGSASFGVEKIKNKSEGIKLINKVFSYRGEKTYFPFQRQKNYILFQNFIEDATYDLRIMVIDDKLLGYYRYPNEGDYKASGAGNYEKKPIPPQALDLAYKVKQLFGANFLATDLLFSKKQNKYFIIESSIFIGVDGCEQLIIDGTPGYYKRISDGEYVFMEGKYWVQELTLSYFFSELIKNN